MVGTCEGKRPTRGCAKLWLFTALSVLWRTVYENLRGTPWIGSRESRAMTPTVTTSEGSRSRLSGTSLHPGCHVYVAGVEPRQLKKQRGKGGLYFHMLEPLVSVHRPWCHLGERRWKKRKNVGKMIAFPLPATQSLQQASRVLAQRQGLNVGDRKNATRGDRSPHHAGQDTGSCPC